MNNIKLDYDGLNNDILLLTKNVKIICDSLDKINLLDKIIPPTWRSYAAFKASSIVKDQVLIPIEDIKSKLVLCISSLVNVSNSFDNLESIIGSELNNWYNENLKIINNNVINDNKL